MKMPEIEKRLVEQMSAIERGIVAQQEKKAAEKKAEDKTPDFSWWQYDDANTYFCVSTSRKYSFKPGQ